MRRARALLLAATLVSTACSFGAGGFLRPYEYEEEIYLSLDGSATVYVNSSVAALNALRGTAFDAGPNAVIDREQFRELYTTNVTHVTATPKLSRRSGRRFVHVQVEVPDIRRLSQAPPFSWSSYELEQEEQLYRFRQEIGRSAGKAADGAGWTGRETVAFRLHVPSEIVYHNAGAGNPRRGNILVWEQPLAERLRGHPMSLEARMTPQSILYRTLWLFAAAFGAVAVTFVLLIWWILRRGGSRAGMPGGAGASNPQSGSR